MILEGFFTYEYFIVAFMPPTSDKIFLVMIGMKSLPGWTSSENAPLRKNRRFLYKEIMISLHDQDGIKFLKEAVLALEATNA